MTDYKKLNNQPLRYVLAEFRFSQIMKINDYIPQLQERLRKKYPIPRQQQEQAVVVQNGGVNFTGIDRWTFLSANQKSAIEVNRDRLMFYTAEYPRFEGFADSCKEALDALIEIAEPSLILRVGLRYGDLVTVDEGENLTDLIDHSFAYPDCVNSLGEARQQRNEVFISTSVGGLLIRSLYGVHNQSCLPDIQGLSVVINQDKEPSERIILDFDHFWESKEQVVSFESQQIMEILESLHETSREAFWKISTDYARNEKWA